MKFQVPLGSKQPRPFKFIHFCQKPTTYQCRIEKLGAKQEEFDPKKKVENLTDFEVGPPSLQQPPCENYDGIEISVDIEFEPSTLAESRALLIISSPEAGEYQCMLYGKSTFPQPKGPYKIEQGKGKPIPFKNPFFKKVDFIIRIDNPAFSCGKNILPLDVRFSYLFSHLFSQEKMQELVSPFSTNQIQNIPTLENSRSNATTFLLGSSTSKECDPDKRIYDLI